jgi:hypothetical protein
MFDLVIASKAPKGSSSSMISLENKYVRRSAALCLIPPESWKGYLFSNPSNPKVLKYPAAIFLAFSLSSPFITSGRLTLSITFIQDNSKSF